MTQILKVTGMTCEACEYKIQHLFSAIEGVKAVKTNRNLDEAILETENNIPLSKFQDALKPFSKYAVSQKVNVPIFEEDTPKTWLETYKPLLLIFVFIIGVSLLTASNLIQFMNSFMAGFFLVFSFFKLLNLKGFAESYAMYDLLAIKTSAYGYIYPFIELALGIAYLVHYQAFTTNILTIIIMGFSSLGVIQSVINKQKIRCACLGAVFNLPMSTVTIIEDLLMVAMAFFMLFFNF